MTKVLFAAAEAVPFVKTGGLADVMSALPKALKKEGVEVALVIPKYEHMNAAYKDKLERVYEGTLDLSWRNQYFGVDKLVLDGVPVYFIDNEWYFKRDGLYGYGDDAERFAFFCKAVLAMLPHIDFKPNIIHCNDWHTGILGTYLKESFYHDEFYWGMKTVYTIHNLKYQGVFGKEIVNDVLGLPHYCFTEGKIEFGGCVNFMKAGMEYADYITTVSPTYAQEITYPYFGEKLEAYVRYCQHKLVGIINGLDEDAYNPATDKFIAAQYNVADAFEKKAIDKENLQKEVGLPVDRNIPVVAMVSRLVEDKGLSLLTRIMDEITQENMQFVVLGAGDQDFQNALKGWEKRNPKKVSINLRFSEELAHKIYAGADIFVMPSRFEACGLSQLIAMKYGTIPVVRETGGLKDTVIPYDKYTGVGNGLSFANFNAHELLFTIKAALSFYEDKAQWAKMVNNAMTSDYGWKASAKAYKDVYDKVMAMEKFVAPAPAKPAKPAQGTGKSEAKVEFKAEVKPIVEAETEQEIKIEEQPAEKSAVKVVIKPEVKPVVEEEVKVAAKKAPARKKATKKAVKKTTAKKTATKKNNVKKAAEAAREVVRHAVAKATAASKAKTGKTVKK